MRRLSLAVVPLLISIVSLSSVTAQEQSSNMVLEEIVVTAEKRGARSTMDTAFSVAALGGDQLEDQGITTINDALALNPGVSVFAFSGTKSFIQMRGVSALVGDSTVGYYLDDLPYTMLGLNAVPDLNPYDLERLEVLRGPQGTLYGASSLGGTVRVLTKAPEHNDFHGKATAGYSSTDGTEDSWTIQGAINIPLIDNTLSARIVGSRIESAGFLDLPLAGEKDYNDVTDESYRAKLRWTPTDNLDLVLSAWHSERDAGLNYAQDDYTWSPVYVVFDALTQAPAGIEPVSGRDLRNTFEGDLYNFRVSYDFGDYSFFSGTSYFEIEEQQDLNYVGVPFDIPYEGDALSQEFRLSFSADAYSWTVGFFYLDAEDTQMNNLGLIFEPNSLSVLNRILQSIGQPTLDNPFFSQLANRTSTTEQIAVFGEVQYGLTEQLHITAGLRYYDDERVTIERSEAGMAGLAALGLSNEWSEDFQKTTGRINLSWTPDEDSLYYLNIAQGFRPGAANPADALINTAVDPALGFEPYTESETIISYELGAKNTLMDGRLAIEAAVYYLDWKDVTASVTTPNSAGESVSARLTANDATGVGLDVGITYRATDALLLNLSGNINKTEYEDDVPGAGVVDGAQLSLAPKSNLNASATYTWQMRNRLNGVLRIAYQYSDERTDFAAGVPPYTSDAIGILRARLGIESNHWTVYLTGENLTDEDGEVSLINSIAVQGVPANRLRPRTIGLEATLNF